MLLLDLLGKLYTTNVVAIAFFYAPACSRFSQPRKVFKLIHFLARNNKNKKYENPLAPTDTAVQTLSRKKRCDSDWTAWTARHSVAGVLHNHIQGGVE